MSKISNIITMNDLYQRKILMLPVLEDYDIEKFIGEEILPLIEKYNEENKPNKKHGGSGWMLEDDNDSMLGIMNLVGRKVIVFKKVIRPMIVL